MTEHRIAVADPAAVTVSAIVTGPEPADRLLVLGHGAGAGMRHRFMEALAQALAERGTTTLRYQFPYAERGARRPDRHPVLHATVRAAVAYGRELTNGTLWAGGKSMGGRMSSLAAANGGLPGVEGLVFFGFPLHAPGKPSEDRADHLGSVDLPMLFLQGTRDALAGLDRMKRVCAGLGTRCTMHVVADADHGFHVRKSSGRDDEAVIAELADVTNAWLTREVARPA